MYLIMTTFVKTSWLISVTYVIYPFLGQFSKIYTIDLSTELFMLKNNFTAVSFKSNTKFSVILI